MIYNMCFCDDDDDGDGDDDTIDMMRRRMGTMVVVYFSVRTVEDFLTTVLVRTQ